MFDFLSTRSSGITTASSATVIGAGASFRFAFSITTGIVKTLFKTAQNQKKKHNKIVMIARSKSNRIERKISEALINNEISHGDFTAIINEERNYRELNESIRIIKSQRSDTEKINLIEEGKRLVIDEIIQHNEVTNNN